MRWLGFGTESPCFKLIRARPAKLSVTTGLPVSTSRNLVLPPRLWLPPLRRPLPVEQKGRVSRNESDGFVCPLRRAGCPQEDGGRLPAAHSPFRQGEPRGAHVRDHHGWLAGSGRLA